MTEPTPDRRDNETIPSDPMTQLGTNAAQIHELYLAFVGAGFTDGQSITLVSAILSAGIHNQNGGTA